MRLLKVAARPVSSRASAAARHTSVSGARVSFSTGRLAKTVLRRAKLTETAVRLYEELQTRGMRPTAAPCTAVLHSFILAGRIDDAFLFYDEQVLGDRRPVEPNTVLFNCLLFGCVRHRDARRGIYVYEYMREHVGCKPDAATYGAVMLLCGQRFQAELQRG